MKKLLLLIPLVLALAGCSMIAELRKDYAELKPTIMDLAALIKEWLPVFKQVIADLMEIIKALKGATEGGGGLPIDPGTGGLGLAAATALGVWLRNAKSNKGKEEMRKDIAILKAKADKPTA